MDAFVHDSIRENERIKKAGRCDSQCLKVMRDASGDVVGGSNEGMNSVPGITLISIFIHRSSILPPTFPS
jgi:hypothetical protein